jgi:hypothetical protein
MTGLLPEASLRVEGRRACLHSAIARPSRGQIESHEFA